MLRKYRETKPLQYCKHEHTYYSCHFIPTVAAIVSIALWMVPLA